MDRWWARRKRAFAHPTNLSRFRHGHALDEGRLYRDLHYFRSRNRRLLVNLFRNKRRRLDLWKHTEFAGYLRERLLLVGPVQGGVVEAVHDGGFDDFEIGRDVEVAGHVERGIADVQDLAAGLSGGGAGDFWQDRIAYGVECL